MPASPPWTRPLGRGDADLFSAAGDCQTGEYDYQVNAGELLVSLKLRIDIAIKPAISGKIASDFAENRQRFPGESPAISRGIASDFQALSQRNKVDYTHSCQTTLPTGTIYGFVGLISKFLGETSGFVAETSEFVAETLKFVGEISKFVGLT